MMYRLKQIWCGWRGHPYPLTIVPIVAEHIDAVDIDTPFCTNCGEAWPTVEAGNWERLPSDGGTGS